MATVDELESAAVQWLNSKRGKLALARTLYLVPGLEDENASCWIGGDNSIVDVWGPRVFSPWVVAKATERLAKPDVWKTANVRVIDFDQTERASFFDFRDAVVDAVVNEYPDDGSLVGEYDIVGHSMGGLDAFVSLVDGCSPAGPLPAGRRIARAFNFVTMDTPYRGIPNVETRVKLAADAKKDQTRALAPGSEQLGLVGAAAADIAGRAVRVTCYGVDSATQVEVTSGNLFADEGTFASVRAQSDYRFFQIPGASHSGPLGITHSTITIANLFFTLVTSERLSPSVVA
jgi:hypothetical protein